MTTFESCLQKQKMLEVRFASCKSVEEKYQLIMQLGKELPPFSQDKKIDSNRVEGCQSIMFLSTDFRDGKLYFEASSDALISIGLAALLIFVYNEETPETVLKCPPDFLNRIGINQAVSPNRSNGLYSIHLKMKQEALRALVMDEKIKKQAS